MGERSLDWFLVVVLSITITAVVIMTWDVYG